MSKDKLNIKYKKETGRTIPDVDATRTFHEQPSDSDEIFEINVVQDPDVSAYVSWLESIAETVLDVDENFIDELRKKPDEIYLKNESTQNC
jgi:hypothetical protein